MRALLVPTFLYTLFFPILEHCATSTRDFSITEMQQNSAAYQVYAKNNSTTSNSKKNNIKNSNNSSNGNNENNNILVQLQELAKRLGFHDMVKNLDHFTYSPNSNSIKKKAHCSKISEKYVQFLESCSFIYIMIKCNIIVPLALVQQFHIEHY